MATIAIALIVAVPILALLAQALNSSSDLVFHIAITVLPTALQNTVVLLLGVGAIVASVGTGAAWLVTAHDFPGRKLMEWALLLPLAVPTYIIAFAYMDILHPIGPVQTTLRALLGIATPQQFRLPDIRSMGGCTVMLGFVLYPYVYVSTRAMFMMQASNILDASRTLGVTRNAVFWRMALPLARPAIAVGTSLALMETLNDIGASEFLGVRTLTVSIYSTWINGADLPGAALIAIVLLAVVFAMINFERWARRHQRFTNLTQRAARMTPRPLPKVQAFAALAACLIPVSIGFLIPVSYLINAAVHRIQFSGFSDHFIRNAANTILFAIIATVVTLTLGTAVAYTRRLRPGTLSKTCMRVATLGYAAPGTVIAIGVLIPFAGLDQLIDQVSRNIFDISTGLVFIGSGAAMIFAYCVRFLSVAIGNVEAGLSRIPLSLDRAARSLGESSASTLRTIHLPLVKPALAAAGLLLFVDCVKELPVTLLLRPLNVETLATQLYAEAARGTYEEGAIAALTIVLIGIIPLILLSRIGRNNPAAPNKTVLL